VRDHFILIGVAFWFATLIGLLVWSLYMLFRPHHPNRKDSHDETHAAYPRRRGDEDGRR